MLLLRRQQWLRVHTIETIELFLAVMAKTHFHSLPSTLLLLVSAK